MQFGRHERNYLYSSCSILCDDICLFSSSNFHFNSHHRNPIPQLGFGDTLLNSSTYLLEKLDQLSVDLGFNAYTKNTKSNIDIFCITAALMFGTAGLPHVIVRFFTVPKVSDAKKISWICF